MGITPITETFKFQTHFSSNSTPISGVLSGAYFALVINSGYTLVAFSSVNGDLIWRKDFTGQIFTMESCSGDNFCVSTDSENSILYLEGATGNQRWSHPGNSVTSHGTNEDYVLIGDGSYLNENLVYLVNAKTGVMIWNISIGDGNTAGDWALTEQFVLVGYTIIGEKRNAYPSVIGGYRLKDGASVFTSGPDGDTMGRMALFDDGDFTALGDEMVAKYDGSTGKVVCAVQKIQAYNMYTQPATYETDFFVTYYQFGWNTQNILRLSCD